MCLVTVKLRVLILIVDNTESNVRTSLVYFVDKSQPLRHRSARDTL